MKLSAVLRNIRKSDLGFSRFQVLLAIAGEEEVDIDKILDETALGEFTAYHILKELRRDKLVTKRCTKKRADEGERRTLYKLIPGESDKIVRAIIAEPKPRTRAAAQ